MRFDKLLKPLPLLRSRKSALRKALKPCTQAKTSDKAAMSVTTLLMRAPSKAATRSRQLTALVQGIHGCICGICGSA